MAARYAQVCDLISIHVRSGRSPEVGASNEIALKNIRSNAVALRSRAVQRISILMCDEIENVGTHPPRWISANSASQDPSSSSAFRSVNSRGCYNHKISTFLSFVCIVKSPVFFYISDALCHNIHSSSLRSSQSKLLPILVHPLSGHDRTVLNVCFVRAI